MSGEFESLFQRLADAAMAPPKLAMMIRRGIFNTRDYATVAGLTMPNANKSLHSLLKRGWIRRVAIGHGGRRGTAVPTTYEWVGMK